MGTRTGSGDRLLAIDVSNSEIMFGLYEGATLQQHWRVQTVDGRTADEYAVLFRTLLTGPEVEGLAGAAMASVVPSVTGIMRELCRDHFGVSPLVVGPGVKTGIPILYDKPQDVGADRIVNALAAYERTKTATIVVDFGTTTVFDFISERGEYVGGVICPGLRIAAEALFARAARLYRVELAWPDHVVGRNTVQAIQSGLLYGHASLVEELVERIRQENGVRGRVLATGGLATLVAAQCPSVDAVDEFLTLDGLRLIYDRNRAEG